MQGPAREVLPIVGIDGKPLPFGMIIRVIAF